MERIVALIRDRMIGLALDAMQGQVVGVVQALLSLAGDRTSALEALDAKVSAAASAHLEAGRLQFPFTFSPSYRLPALLFGVTPATAWVETDEAQLRVRFGPWSLRTPRTNVASTHETGGFSFVKTVGPAHLSFADHGVTFATNGDSALCALFEQPVRAIDPTGRIRHPGATLTVAEPAALIAALKRRQRLPGGRSP